MRAIAWIIGALAVTGVLIRTVWVESQATACDFETRALREREGEFENQELLLDAEIAQRSTVTALEATARKLGILQGLEKRSREPKEGIPAKRRPVASE